MAPFQRLMDFWRQTGWPIITADSWTRNFSRDQELFERYSCAADREWLMRELIKIDEGPRN